MSTGALRIYFTQEDLFGKEAFRLPKEKKGSKQDLVQEKYIGICYLCSPLYTANRLDTVLHCRSGLEEACSSLRDCGRLITGPRLRARLVKWIEAAAQAVVT